LEVGIISLLNLSRPRTGNYIVVGEKKTYSEKINPTLKVAGYFFSFFLSVSFSLTGEKNPSTVGGDINVKARNKLYHNMCDDILGLKTVK